MAETIKRVAVTGGAGHIGYSLLFRIASGDLFGKEVPIALHILEIPEMMLHLEGIKMELEDCAFPLLKEIQIGSDAKTVFEGVELAILIGAKPRSAGMERRDLLIENAKIFLEQGNALEYSADQNCRVLVVGNPCNTNCWIAKSRAKRLNPNHFYAMTRLDQNRAAAFLATRANVDLEKVENVIVWGNHSSTQVPSYHHATVDKKPVVDVIKDIYWLEEEFIPLVQQRGSQIIKVRGKSSAASAAHAIVDTINDIYTPTKPGRYYSLGVDSTGNPYGIRDNLIFSFPCRTNHHLEVEIVPDLSLPPALKKRLDATERELIEEQSSEIAFMTRI
jgi:malate dehydrogenase